jgi:hypothetical protein
MMLTFKMLHVERPPIPRLTEDLDSFQLQWDVFSSGLFRGMDLSNIFFAGGGVLAAATKVDTDHPTMQNRKTSSGKSENNVTTKDLLGFSGNIPDDEDEDDLVFNLDEEQDEEEEVSLEPNVFVDEQVMQTQAPGDTIRNMMSSGAPGGGLTQTSFATTNLFEANSYKEKLKEYYNQSKYNASDVDIFLYGLSEEEAEKKVIHIYETFKKNLTGRNDNTRVSMPATLYNTTDGDIMIIRTKHAITFHFGYPIRPVQIILRIYKSPAEILMGFDVDCCCIGYDGKQVYCLPRARRAINTRMNLVDVERQSTTYEVRLFKYAKRGFRVVSIL